MISIKNNHVKHVLSILILASCSSTSLNFTTSSDESYSKANKRNLQDISAYNTFSENDLKIIQNIINNQKLSQSELRDLKLLKKNLNWKLILNPDLNFPVAYMNGDIVIENASLLEFLNLLFKKIMMIQSLSGSS